MPQTKSIVFVLPNLKLGGVERLSLELGREFLRRGHTVEFVAVSAHGELSEEIHAEFPVTDLGARRFISSVWPLRRYLRSRKPDLIIARLWPLTTISVWARILAGNKGALLISDHGVLSTSTQAKGLLRKSLLKLSMIASYRFADRVVAVSGGLAEEVAHLGLLRKSRVEVIYNPAGRGKLPEGAHPDGVSDDWLRADLKIIAAGRLKKVKGFDTLIRAFARAQVSLPTAHLMILGDGECRAELEALVEKLGVGDIVTIRGFVDDTYPYFLRADLFVLSSRSEGFGNVLVEAMECGLSIVSTDCDYGPREILCGGKYGRLVPVDNVEALAEAIVLETGSPSASVEGLRRRALAFEIGAIATRYLEGAPGVGGE